MILEDVVVDRANDYGASLQPGPRVPSKDVSSGPSNWGALGKLKKLSEALV